MDADLPSIDEGFSEHFDLAELLAVEVLDSVISEFKAVIPEIFGDNLSFGFIFGGFAKGYALRNSDIDMFVCLNALDSNQITRFRSWYLAIHDRANLQSDLSDPGEVMDYASLSEKLDFVAANPLRPIIPSYYEFEAIVWADAMCGPKVGIVGDTRALSAAASICDGLAQRWRHDFYRFGTVPVAELAVRLPPTLLCRNHLVFRKWEGHRPLSIKRPDDVTR